MEQKKKIQNNTTGKVVMFPSCKRHNLSKRSRKMKRSAKGPTIMSKQDSKIVKKYMNVKKSNRGKMSRVKAGVITRTRHKKIIKRAKDIMAEGNTFKAANQAVEKKQVNTPTETEK